MITFCRVRPAGAVHEAWAAARYRQGTTVVEMAAPGSDDVASALTGGLLPVARSGEVAAWVGDPGAVLALTAAGTPGWRITLEDRGTREDVLDALVRSGAAFLRTGRSRVAAAASLAVLPGITTRVSVFVDDVADAVAAVEDGAGDLLLRDWDTERLGQLRAAVRDRLLVERGAFPVGLELDAARDSLPAEVFGVYLGQVDGSGTVRPRGDWAVGRDHPIPAPARRLSVEWADPAWREAAPRSGTVRSEIAGIVERSLGGARPDLAEIEMLFRARGAEVEVIAAAADELRRRAVGDTVTYVVNRNINYTNQCTYRCGFCAFSRGPRSLDLRGDPYLMETHEVGRRAAEAAAKGATEVCLQGGIHPGFTGDFYLETIEAVRRAAPGLHVHGFTPLEVWQGAATLGLDVRTFLIRLRDAGLGTLPGTAAEILDDRVRRHLCPDKITTVQWAEVMVTAHELGLRSTATVMFGHVDGPVSWAAHLGVVRRIQERTGGFTELVPLPFVHMGAPIYLRGAARPGPTWDEVVLMHAVARIAFDGLIPNIQISWAKLGLDGAEALLGAGGNDLGGTLMDENISRAAGAAHGQVVSASDVAQVAFRAGRRPAQRTTLYEVLEHDSPG